MRHIDTTEKQIEFKSYLENSPRIIFSAKFGDGKTQFLNEIMQNVEFKEYQFFTIYPVNYVVAENTDIFEYVKRDILLQLADAGLLNDLDLAAIGSSIATLDNLKDVIDFLLSFVKGGDIIKKLIEKGIEIKRVYDERKTVFDKYDGSFISMKGGLYEEDGYTIIIREALNYLRKSNFIEGGNKKSVLIIEDLDRLAPGHLFRILNVISAHVDSHAYNQFENKFGFDNIIIVMDYNVTKKVFQHFYGPDASYDGYMSKFMTCQPFYYSLNFQAKHTFYSAIVDFVGLSDLVECMPNMKKHIAEMSVRDICRVMSFDYKTRQKKVSTEIMNHQFSSELPIFRLLCLMIECGLSKKEIEEDLLLQSGQNVESYIELVYPLHLQASDMFFNSYLVGNNVYDALLKSKLVEKVEIERVASRRQTTKDIKSTNIKFYLMFRMLEQCYNVSSLIADV